MTYRIEFQEEMALLHREIIHMGARVEDAIHKSIKALIEDDVALAEAVIEGDDAIDQLERDINQACIRTIARQKPVAGDLRDVAANMKLVTDLERIADHAEDISQRVIRMHDSRASLFIPDDILMIADVVKSMLHGALDAYVTRNLELAYRVIRLDDKTDRLADELTQELSRRMASDRNTNLDVLLDLLLITYHLERAADHAQNVAEWIVYYIEGKYAYENGNDAADETEPQTT